MKVAFISDVHANLEALQTVMRKIKKINPKKIYCIGDLCGYGADPNAVIEIIKKRNIPCVKGNHESAVTTGDTSWFNPVAAQAIEWTIEHLHEEDFRFLSNLKDRFIVRIENYKAYMVHGSPRDFLWGYLHEEDVNGDFVKEFDADILVIGHTHIPFIKKIKDKLVINCGAVGQPRDGINKASFAVFDTEKFAAEIVRVDYDIKYAAEKIIKAGLPSFLAQRLFLGV